MTDLIAKAKREMSNKQLADKWVKHAESLPKKEQEALAGLAMFTALENASYDAFLLSPTIARRLRQLSAGTKSSKAVDSKKVSKVEQAIVKTFRENPHLLGTLDQLDDVAREGLLGVLAKHLDGEHDQQSHAGDRKKKDKNQLSLFEDEDGTKRQRNPAPVRGKNIQLPGFEDPQTFSQSMKGNVYTSELSTESLSISLDPGEGSRAIALALRMPEGLAEKIGSVGATVNDVLNNKTGEIGRRIWGVASRAGDFALTNSPMGTLVAVGQLIQQYGPGVMKHGLRNYYRFSGNERPIPEGLGSKGQGFEGTRNAVVERLVSGLPSEKAAQNSKKYVPSEGYIIAPDGRIVARAIGRGGRLGDGKPTDFYTPYTLSQLRSVKGNALVRRRMWGGPTEEDIRMGLLLGASEITTVSNTGTYRLKLTGEGQGVNSELPLILNRLTELRGQKGNSNHDNTSLALESLSAEFPIHFQQYTQDDGRALHSNSYEEGLKEEGFLTGLLNDWETSLFGERSESSNGGGGGKEVRDHGPKPDGNVPGSSRKREVGDQGLRDKATQNAKPVTPPDVDLKSVKDAVDNQLAANGVDLQDEVGGDELRALSDTSESLLEQFDYRPTKDERIAMYGDTPEEAFEELARIAAEIDIPPSDVAQFYREEVGFVPDNAAEMYRRARRGY